MAAKKKKPVAKKKSAPAKKASLAKKAAPAKTLAAKIPTNFAPLDDRLFVEVAEAETRTAGGLYIPESAGGRPSRGTVLAAGRGRRTKKGTLLPLDVRVGDQVLYAEYSGTKLSVDGREVLILRESEVLGIVE